MVEPTTSKSKEYVESHFSTLNAHADGVVDNEEQLSRLKRFKADRVWIKNAGLVLLILGIFAILLAFAYNKYKAPVFQVVEKPVYIDKPIYNTIKVPEYIDKPIYNTIKVPDPELSKVIERPVYITKIIRVPIQITKREGVAQEFTFFNIKEINKDGINVVTVGASFESVNSPYPESQWCYTTSIKSIGDNTFARLNLANKKGLEAIRYSDVTSKDAKVFGSTKIALEGAKKQCEFFPSVPPIEEESGSVSIPPTESFPSEPPTSGGKSGTGFYINPKGYVVTNEHVVPGCSSVWIKDGNENIPGIVVKKDKKLDIAVIKANKNSSVYAKFADDIRTGEDVWAFGFPLGSELGDSIKVTKGNISAVSGMRGDKNYLQFTAPIQAGNSGGPLLNEGGFVVGINTETLEGIEFQNLNFAINGNSAQNFLGANSIDFEYGKYDESEILKPADLAKKGEAFTVRVLCQY